MIKVLFNLEMEYHLNSLYPLYEQYRNDKDYDIYFRVGKDPAKFLGLFKYSRKKKIISRLEESDIQITETTTGFDVVICGDALISPENYGDAIKIHVDHGVGIKTSRIRNLKAQKNQRYHVFLEGDYWYDYIKSLGWEDIAEFYRIGIPKLDPLFWAGKYNAQKLITELGISTDKKCVLFAPSYKPSCIDEVKDKISLLAENYNLIIKLHPYSWSGRYAPHSHHRFYEKLAADNKDIYLIPRDDYDIYPYLNLADTLISDTSSVINEFLALGKHGIIYVLSNFKDVHSDGMPVLSIDPEDWLKNAFVHVHHPDELMQAVKMALDPTSHMKEELKKFRNYLFTGLDGNSSQRVKEKVAHLLKVRN
jgi:CDP-glycerol glycerophosphotransferase (TagB/SpsB family)